MDSHVSSVREEECVTRQAYPSRRCVPQDTTVLQGPLLLDPVLQSVLYLCVAWYCDCPSSCLSLFFSLVLSRSPTCRLCLLVLHSCFINCIYPDSNVHNYCGQIWSSYYSGLVLWPARWRHCAALSAMRGRMVLQQSRPLCPSGSLLPGTLLHLWSLHCLSSKMKWIMNFENLASNSASKWMFLV